MRKIFILCLAIFLVSGLLIGFNVLAEEENGDVAPDDLEVSKPKLLPNNPFYFLKSFWRQLRITFAFSSVKKAELRLQFVSEMLAEAKRLAEEKDNPELFQRAIDKYQRQMDKLQARIEKVQEKTEDDSEENSKVDAFLNRFNKKIELHQSLMEKLEEKLENPQAQETTREARQRTIQRLNAVKESLLDRIRERSKNRMCEDVCGDGVCQEIVCMATDCPCPETPRTCPADCPSE